MAAAVEALQGLAKEIDDRSEIAQVATISANNDSAIGDRLAEAIDKVGKDGVVTVEESNTFGLDLEFTEGMQFDKGYLSPYFVTDAERQEAVLDEPYILFNSGKISSVQTLVPALEATRDLFLFARLPTTWTWFGLLAWPAAAVALAAAVFGKLRPEIRDVL